MATPVTPAAAAPGAAAAAPQRQMKYIVVTGGVVSGLGKGITISSIGRLLKANGLRVTSIKIDPYLNTDAGTMSPFEHGETFVLDDGGETDLDLGNYERFLDLASDAGPQHHDRARSTPRSSSGSARATTWARRSRSCPT